MLDFENQYYSKKIVNIAGTDEAGRGPLAGPVYCAAVIFPKGYQNEDINDSKKLSEKKRDALAEIIKRDALAYSIVAISPEEIDKINIYEASRKGMEEALHSLNVKYDLVLTDYMPLFHEDCEVIPLVKGDAKAMCIAAASILAKTSRDQFMCELDKKYPQYGFAKHKGYPTKEHIDALKQYGPIEGIHRFSYGPVKNCKIEQLKLF